MLNPSVRLVMTWAAMIAGVGAILLPFTFGTSPRAATFDRDFWWVAVPFYIAIPIGLASLRCVRSGLRSSHLRVSGWIVSAAGAGVTAYFCLFEILGEQITQHTEWLTAGVPLGVLAAGAVLLLRQRGANDTNADRSIAAMQVAYLANASFCLIEFGGEWQSGAWCALVTVLIYVVQISSEMNRTDAAAPESNGRPAASPFARLFVMAVTATSITASGCGGSPTQPSQGDRIALYSGQWSALIGDVQIVVQLRAVPGFFAPALDGLGTAVNRTTGETHQLHIHGSGTMSDDTASGAFLNIGLADEVSRDGIRPGAKVGQFWGNILPDGRTWAGRYRAWSECSDCVDIFGLQEVPVTFTKD